MANDTDLETLNAAPGNFTWTDENIPLITPEYFVYDNSDNSSWNTLKTVNAYPKPKDNNSSTSISSEDNFNTHNNIVYRDYFEHKQGLIRPLKDQSIDGWYDVGLKSVMFNNGIPYTTPNFQKTIYVWYIKGDGTDYPYDDHVGMIYPGQEKNFPYRYNDLSKAVVKSGNIIKIKGNTPSFRYGNAKSGFFVRLNNPNEKCNCIAKIDLGLMSTTGHRWHYQGFTLICKTIFKKYPTTTINLDMKADDAELDITALIDTNIDWKFSVLEFISTNNNVCTVETDWISNTTNPKFGDKPTYIKLKGNPDVLESTVNITIRARPINTTYTEEVTFKVRVKQLYNKDTLLDVTPKHIVTMVGVEAPYEVQTDASTYTVSTDNRDLIRLYKGKIQGIKQGTGVLTFRAQAAMSKPNTVKVPFTVNKYIPEPIIETPEYSITVEEGTLRETYIITNCPKSNIKVSVTNPDVIILEDTLVWEDLEQNTEFPRRKCKFKFRSLIEGTTNINIKGYIVEGNVALSKNIAVTVTEKPVPIEPPTTDDTGEFGVIGKTDAYLAFHHQREGVMTYLKSKSKNIPADRLEQEVDIDHTANKIYIIPEATQEDIRLNKSEVFHLALREDITDSNSSKGNTNPNYLDYKEEHNPMSGFTGNATRPINYWLNIKTGERFIKDTLTGNNVRWRGDRGTTVGVMDVNRDGIGPAPHEISCYYGLRALKGCYDPNSDNYGNYEDEHGTIYVYIPLHYIIYISGNDGSKKLLHNKKLYWPLTINHTNFETLTLAQDYVTSRYVRDEKGTIIDLNTNTALKKRMRLPSAFINNNKILPGLFIKKYPNNISTVIGNKTYINTMNSNGVIKNNKTIRFTAVSEVHNNSNTIVNGSSDEIWANVFKTKRLTGKTNTKFTTRVLNNLSFNTIAIRNMLSDLIVYNNTESIYQEDNRDNSIVNVDGSKPYTGKTTNATDQYDTGYGDLELDGLAYSYDYTNKVKYSHNGKKSGIFGLSDGNLELVIGAYIVPNFTVANGAITNTRVELHTYNKSTNYITLTTNWVNAVTNKTAIPTLPKVYSDLTNNTAPIMPVSIVNKKLLTSTKTNYPIRIKCDNNILDRYTSLETDVNVGRVNNDTVIYHPGINMGVNGTFVENTANNKRTDYDSRTYNSLSNMNIHIDHLNLGDANTGFFVSSNNRYTAQELAANFKFYMIPLYGGVMKYTETNGLLDVANQHFNSVTWYRVGYNLSTIPNATTKNIGMRVFSRYVIMPDMAAIKTYVTNGTYEKERNDEISKYGDTCGILTVKNSNTSKWE